jgi:hypothetical protein
MLNESRYEPFRRVVQSIADALQMRLLLSVKDGSAEIRPDKQTVGVDTGGFLLDFELSVRACGVFSTQAWVLVHVSGALYLFLSSVDRGAKSYLWVIDSDRTDSLDWVQTVVRLKGLIAVQAGQELQPYCVAVYSHRKGRSEWRVKHAPESSVVPAA